MDTRPAEHLTDDQIRTINTIRSYEKALEITLRSSLSRGSETSGAPSAVQGVFKGLVSWADSAVLAVTRYPRT